jgi:[ribosomal protein S18]-alanine N-acetyltransferase
VSPVLQRMRWWDLGDVLAVEGPSFGPDAWSAEQLLSELAERDSRHYLVLRDRAAQHGAAQHDAAQHDAAQHDTAQHDTAEHDAADERDGEPLLGYLGVAVHGPDAEVQTVAVAPGVRGRGLGRLLVDAARDVARRAGARRLGLEVREDDEVAVGLYRATGFTRTGRRPGYYASHDGSGRVAALLMDLDLTGPDLTGPDPAHLDPAGVDR